LTNIVKQSIVVIDKKLNEFFIKKAFGACTPNAFYCF